MKDLTVPNSPQTMTSYGKELGDDPKVKEKGGHAAPTTEPKLKSVGDQLGGKGGAVNAAKEFGQAVGFDDIPRAGGGCFGGADASSRQPVSSEEFHHLVQEISHMPREQRAQLLNALEGATHPGIQIPELPRGFDRPSPILLENLSPDQASALKEAIGQTMAPGFAEPSGVPVSDAEFKRILDEVANMPRDQRQDLLNAVDGAAHHGGGPEPLRPNGGGPEPLRPNQFPPMVYPPGTPFPVITPLNGGGSDGVPIPNITLPPLTQDQHKQLREALATSVMQAQEK